MNTKHTLISALIVASALFNGVAQAQGYGCDFGGGRGPAAMMRDGDASKRMAERTSQRLDRLHADLKITAQQEPLWQAFAEKSRAEVGKGMQAMQDLRNDTKLTAPERMEKMQAAMRERMGVMEGLHDSFKRLYAALTPEQQAKADTHFNRQWGGRTGERPMRQGPAGEGRGPAARN